MRSSGRGRIRHGRDNSLGRPSIRHVGSWGSKRKYHGRGDQLSEGRQSVQVEGEDGQGSPDQGIDIEGSGILPE